MERPVSIMNFERCYLGALVLGLINSALSWDQRMQMVQVQQARAQFGGGFAIVLVGGVVLGLAIALLLWFLAARKGYVGAKWVIVVFYAIALLGFVFGLIGHRLATGVSGVLTVVGLVLQGIAVWLLFQPDARVWFREETPGDSGA